MMQNPIIIKDDKNTIQLRANNSDQLLLGDPSFYIKGYKYERDRI